MFIGKTFEGREFAGNIGCSDVGKGYVVPFKQSFERLINNKNVKEYLLDQLNPCRINNENMRDIFDGNYFDTREYNKSNTLCLCLYYDDFEMVNPLSKGKSKHVLCKLLTFI